ncbi:MAG TPA: glycosyltransferase, partial [Gemmatimonadaceae bacterium]|nr:glycosyltransferase [Gemmatimonadaceae bacterium]
MRVLHITTAFPREPGDVITPWLVELLKRLRAAGVESEVLTSSYKGLADQSFEGIRVHRFRYFARRWENLTHEETAPDRMRKSLLYKLLPLFFVGAGMIAAWRLARRERYDVIHVHWPLPLAALGWAASRAARAPTVTLFYGVELRWVASGMRALRGFLRWAIRRSDAVVAISSYTAREVEALVPRPVEVIPYTFELSSAGQRVAHATPGFEILTVGRLVERKGIVVLVDALARLPRELHARLTVIGDGPEMERIRSRAVERGVADRVALRGRQPDDVLRAAYASADVFVLPA